MSAPRSIAYLGNSLTVQKAGYRPALHQRLEQHWEAPIHQVNAGPAQVLPLQFPYSYDVHTQQCFGSSQNLLEGIVNQLNPASFDVALIAGSSLGIPIAAAIKRMNRSAIALGGALQVLFGVGGRRWWNDPHWQQHHITPAWISVPPELVPRVAGGYVDGGAYWW